MQRVLAMEQSGGQSSQAWAARLDAAVAAGFRVVEVPAAAPPDWISQVSQRGLRPLVVRWASGLLERRAGPADSFTKPAVADLVSALEWTASIGGSVLTVRPAGAAPGGNETRVARYADALWDTHNALEALCGPTARTGVFVGVEAVSDGCLLSPVELRDLLDRVNSPYVAACLNLTSIARIGEPLGWIRTLRHRIVCVRLGDEEGAQLDETAAALQEVLYTGPVVCGGEPAEAAQRLSRFPVSSGE